VIANAGPVSLAVSDVSVDTPLFNLAKLPLSVVFIDAVVQQKTRSFDRIDLQL
jgi:hypothetical protein